MNGRGHLIAQAVRGPVLLITLGFLFALQQAGVVSFGRTWPLILIVMGVMKLIERMLMPPVPRYMPPPPPYTPPFGPPPPPPGGPHL